MQTVKTKKEFFDYCENQKKIAVKMANGNQELVKRIEKIGNSEHIDFYRITQLTEEEKKGKTYLEICLMKTETIGYLLPFALNAQSIFNRAESDMNYNAAMTVLDNENKLYS